MAPSALARVKEIFSRIGAWTFVRFLLFTGAVLLGHQLPGWAKGPAWLFALGLGVWAFLGFVRSTNRLADSVEAPLSQAWKRLGAWVTRHQKLWKWLTTACVFALLGILWVRAWPTWHFLATSSLREDEILNITRYTSKGFAPAVGTYDFARNHIFFNVVNSLLPGADSLWPLRGRLVSLTSVLAALALLVCYAARRGWLLAGVVAAGFVAVNHYALKVLLEGRGYGLICLFGMIGSITLAEWCQTKNKLWLSVLAVTCVLGTYTLPYYIVFGGALVLAAFFYRPSRDTLLAGVFSAVAIGMLYLPVLNKVLQVASGYDEEYGDSVTYNFGAMIAAYRTLQYFIPYEVLQVGPFSFTLALLLVLVFLMMGRFARFSDRQAAAGVGLGILAILAFFFFLQSPPIRVSAFLAGPQAFLATLMAGSALAARSLAALRPLTTLGFAGVAGFVLWNAQSGEPLVPRQDWDGAARLIRKAFPADGRIWVRKKYAKLMRGYLPDERIEQDALDWPALQSGELLAFDASFKGGPEREQFHWKNLPEGTRYVTLPLLISFHRLYFLPPEATGILRVEVNGSLVPTRVSARQPRDPFTLSSSAGLEDPLYRGEPDDAAPDPPALPLPAEVIVKLEANAPQGVCNLLFSQTLADKVLSAALQDANGKWHPCTPFVVSELASVPLNAAGSRALRLQIAPNPQYLPGPHAQGRRPPFWLAHAWVSPK